MTTIEKPQKEKRESKFGLSPKEKGALLGIIWYFKENAKPTKDQLETIESIIYKLDAIDKVLEI